MSVMSRRRTLAAIALGAAALLAVSAMQFPNAALALNPQPEVPSTQPREASPKLGPEERQERQEPQTSAAEPNQELGGPALAMARE